MSSIFQKEKKLSVIDEDEENDHKVSLIRISHSSSSGTFEVATKPNQSQKKKFSHPAAENLGSPTSPTKSPTEPKSFDDVKKKKNKLMVDYSDKEGEMDETYKVYFLN